MTESAELSLVRNWILLPNYICFSLDDEINRIVVLYSLLNDYAIWRKNQLFQDLNRLPNHRSGEVIFEDFVLIEKDLVGF